MQRAQNQSRLLTATGFDPLESFRNSLRADPPWDSIVDFATHKSFCGKRMYPRQLTLLKLIYLETENFTQYDYDVIEEWTEGFRKRDPEGIQPDVLDRVDYLKKRGYRWFPHVQAVLGRRASKGLTGGIIGAHQLAYMYSLDDWQNHFGFDPGLDGYLTVVATNQTQAMKFQFADLRRSIVGCKYLEGAISTNKGDEIAIRTKADERAIADLVMRKVPIETEIATLRAVAMSSNSASGRGGAGFSMFFDEFAFMLTGTGGVRTSEEVYAAYMPSLRQFGKFSLTYIPSSPFTMVGQFFTLYTRGTVMMPVYMERNGLEFKEVTEKDLKIDAEEELTNLTANPEMLVVQLPSWGLYKDWDKSNTLNLDKCHPNRKNTKFKGAVQVDPDHEEGPEVDSFRREERQNPEKFRVEYRAQFAAVTDAYLDAAKIEAMFVQPNTMGTPWRESLSLQTFGRFDRLYRAHGDPSTVNANFGFAIAHLEDAPPDEYGVVWPHVVFDVLHVWRPEDYPDHTVDYLQVGRDLENYIRAFPSMTKVTFDQYHSQGFIQSLNNTFAGQTRIAELEPASQPYNTSRAEKFKAALNLGWVHSYRDSFFRYQEARGSLLEQELKFLQYDNGKVVKQESGPVTTKDLADCVMSVTVDLLSEQLDRYSSHLATVQFGSTDVAAIRSPDQRETLRMEQMNAAREGTAAVRYTPERLAAANRNRQNLHGQFLERRKTRQATGTSTPGATRGGRWR